MGELLIGHSQEWEHTQLTRVMCNSVCSDWRLCGLQEAERDELVQAKDRELAQAQEASGRLQQQIHELRRQV